MEEETLDPKLHVLIRHLWRIWQRPVKIHIVIDLGESILLGNDAIQSFWQLRLHGTGQLFFNRVNNIFLEKAFESISNLTDKITLNLDRHMVTGNVHGNASGSESRHNLSVRKLLSSQTNTDGHVDVGH